MHKAIKKTWPRPYISEAAGAGPHQADRQPQERDRGRQAAPLVQVRRLGRRVRPEAEAAHCAADSARRWPGELWQLSRGRLELASVAAAVRAGAPHVRRLLKLKINTVVILNRRQKYLSVIYSTVQYVSMHCEKVIHFEEILYSSCAHTFAADLKIMICDRLHFSAPQVKGGGNHRCLTLYLGTSE